MRAISLRLFFERDSALALPPLRPPSRPSKAAAALLASSSAIDGDPDEGAFLFERLAIASHLLVESEKKQNGLRLAFLFEV
jgi:hypothetical protein